MDERGIEKRGENTMDRVVYDAIAHRRRRDEALLGLSYRENAVAAGPIAAHFELAMKPQDVSIRLQLESPDRWASTLAPAEFAPRRP